MKPIWINFDTNGNLTFFIETKCLLRYTTEYKVKKAFFLFTNEIEITVVEKFDPSRFHCTDPTVSIKKPVETVNCASEN